MPKFLKKLNKALDNSDKAIDEALEQTTKLKMVGGDKPDAGNDGINLDQTKLVNANLGTHRFDPAVKVRALEIEREFDSMEHKQSDNARPGLE